MIPPDPERLRWMLQQLGESGQPPEEGLELFNCGNEGLISTLEQRWLVPIARTGRGSTFKLVLAHYGGGKTHFLLLCRARAEALGFASALVQASPEECPLDEPMRLYQAVARGLRWPSGGPGLGLEALLRWGLSDPASAARIHGLELESAGVKQAAVRLSRAWTQGEGEPAALCLAFLRGEAVSLSELRPLGIREAPSRKCGLLMLRSLCQLLVGLGVTGLLLGIDELDRSLTLPQRRRLAIADQLRQLVDLCGRGSLPGLVCLAAAPPDFLRTVVAEYPALQQRLEGPSVLSQRSPQAAVIDLEEMDLGGEELLYRIGLRLLDLFNLAHGARLDRGLQAHHLRQLAHQTQSSAFDSAHRRAYVKAAIDLLHRQMESQGLVADQELRELSGRGGRLVLLRSPP